jgi:hypothetical protein
LQNLQDDQSACNHLETFLSLAHLLDNTGIGRNSGGNMTFRVQRTWAMVTAFTVLSMSVGSQTAVGQEHVVPLSELRDSVRSVAEARATNLADIQRVLSLPAAREALQKSNVNQDQVRKAVAVLSDEEISRLADRARATEQDVQGGLIVGLLALIGLIVVVIIVVSLVR